ncbi:SufE family protein [Pseudomarimonas arenosa]|uniref:SufE family protein n=1 Tax=Pseudomarimonas arenosa TaxID=2774145 RepID=A0AAW3ZJP8_9GAMM|nr:SufE family protein [Pseudomarimonas arenosa]MBD8526305.1 SufE family protein [Pseudomarimonas arenosa]
MSEAFLRPSEPSIEAAQAEIVDEFAFFSDWSERYQYLIDIGKRLPTIPEAWMVEELRVTGCQSRVWLVAEGDASNIVFAANSDSAIVSGLIYLALRVFSGRSAAAILSADVDYIQKIGLAKHLSPTRSNGLAAALALIKHYAQRAVEGERLTAPTMA